MRRTSVAAALALALAAGGCGASSGTSTGAPDTASAVPFDQALHDSLPQRIRDAGVIRLVTDASYAPLEQFAPDGRTIIGFEPDMAQALGQILGVKVEMVTGTFQTALDDVVAGTYDGVLSAMTDTPQREKKVDFVNYLAAGTSIIVQRGNPNGITDIPALCGRVVAIEKGTTQADLLRRSQAGCGTKPIHIGEYPTNADAMLQLRTGRAVAVLQDYPAAVHIVTDTRTRNNFTLASSTQYEPGLFGIPFAKGDSRLREAVRGALDKLIESGAYATLLDRWDLSAGAIKSATVNGATAG
ncbi:ABC transporter substrate-binding protein [Actinoplanes sp. TFC3]|uniref:ABC transporter substrate-binding protein n=1 Tax=Actinoplanes sp. TFC3 TaxID=1710355 RepID=UPI00082A75CF|nr:ABC transporter substrate-binding protein [Actinoplanes sp. TFC3]